MKYRYLLATTLFILACGTLPTVARMPLPATQTDTDTQSSSYDIQTTPTPFSMITVLGDASVTWNIRTGPSLDFPTVGIAHGGMVFEKLSSDGGWIKIETGWICGQAFGMNDKCD